MKWSLLLTLTVALLGGPSPTDACAGEPPSDPRVAKALGLEVPAAAAVKVPSASKEKEDPKELRALSLEVGEYAAPLADAEFFWTWKLKAERKQVKRNTALVLMSEIQSLRARHDKWVKETDLKKKLADGKQLIADIGLLNSSMTGSRTPYNPGKDFGRNPPSMFALNRIMTYYVLNRTMRDHLSEYFPGSELLPDNDVLNDRMSSEERLSRLKLVAEYWKPKLDRRVITEIVPKLRAVLRKKPSVSAVVLQDKYVYKWEMSRELFINDKEIEQYVTDYVTKNYDAAAGVLEISRKMIDTEKAKAAAEKAVEDEVQAAIEKKKSGKGATIQPPPSSPQPR